MTKWVFRIATGLGGPALAGLLWMVPPDGTAPRARLLLPPGRRPAASAA
jgi:hypothetical protein